MKNKIFFIGAFSLIVLASFINVSAQLSLPRESQRMNISQLVGDTTISLAFDRPNIKNRKVWGELVPYDQVWRTGANEATVFEVTNDVKINGQPLPKGKYSLHTIPTAGDWTIIFNKTSNQWGSFNYDAKQDALRVTAKPQKSDFHETMAIGFENVKPTSTDVVIAWEYVHVPFTIDVGDVTGRTLAEIRRQMTTLKTDDATTPLQAASWVLSSKLTGSYDEALSWLDASIKARETFANLSTKARLLAQMGKKQEAITIGEKAVSVGKAATPRPANTAAFEKTLAEWKAGK